MAENVKTFEDFLQFFNITDWPYPLASEQLYDLQHEIKDFLSAKDIQKWLTSNINFEMDLFDNMETELEKHEANLHDQAKWFLNDEALCLMDSLQEHQVVAVEQRIDAELFEHIQAVQNTSELVRSRNKKQAKQTQSDDVSELKEKTADYCKFSGFNPDEFNEWPCQMEVAPVLHRVSKIIRIKDIDVKHWQKIIQSEASVAVMQDLFWYILLDYFQAPTVNESHATPLNKDGHDATSSQVDHEENDPGATAPPPTHAFFEANKLWNLQKAQLFSRIADSFAALFFSIHPDNLSRFMRFYPDTLAMCVYSAYYEAFPHSRMSLDHVFQQYVIDTVHMWMTGGHPVPGGYLQWNIDALQRTDIQVAMKAVPSNSSKSGVAGAVSNCGETVNATTGAVTEGVGEVPPTESEKAQLQNNESIQEMFDRVERDMNLTMNVRNAKKFVRISTKLPSVSMLDMADVANMAMANKKLVRGSPTDDVAPELPQPPVIKDEQTLKDNSYPFGLKSKFRKVHFAYKQSSPLIQKFFSMHGKSLPEYFSNTVRPQLMQRTELVDPPFKVMTNEEDMAALAASKSRRFKTYHDAERADKDQAEDNADLDETEVRQTYAQFIQQAKLERYKLKCEFSARRQENQTAIDAIKAEQKRVSATYKQLQKKLHQAGSLLDRRQLMNENQHLMHSTNSDS